MRTLRFPAALTALAVCLTLSTQARADLIITVNGIVKATDVTNTFASFMGSIDTFNINNISMAGVNAFGGNSMLVDNGSMNISSAGIGSLTILLTETNLNLGTQARFDGAFTGTITNATATRSFFVDPTNAGLLTNLLGSTTAGGGSFNQSVNLGGPFSLTEQIVLTATGAGATLSSDDHVAAPEPASLALLGGGLAAFGMIRRRRRS